jgi:hypothetical protein
MAKAENQHFSSVDIAGQRWSRINAAFICLGVLLPFRSQNCSILIPRSRTYPPSFVAILPNKTGTGRAMPRLVFFTRRLELLYASEKPRLDVYMRTGQVIAEKRTKYRKIYTEDALSLPASFLSLPSNIFIIFSTLIPFLLPNDIKEACGYKFSTFSMQARKKIFQGLLTYLHSIH